MSIVIILVLLILAPVLAWADDKKPSCETKLAETSLQAYNLDQSRDSTEQALAKEQFKSYTLSQQVTQLQKQVDELKKAAAPKVEDKAKE